jgi:LacI family transcriptional regulator
MTKAITIYDVAKLADVSIATVSRVLNGSPKVRPLTAMRVNRAVSILGFVPNEQAVRLATLRTD